MRLSSIERRSRLEKLAQLDSDYCTASQECEKQKAWFTKITDKLPRKWRQRFWAYPGMQYFVFTRMLTLACENMRFPDEDPSE